LYILLHFKKEAKSVVIVSKERSDVVTIHRSSPERSSPKVETSSPEVEVSSLRSVEVTKIRSSLSLYAP